MNSLAVVEHVKNLPVLPQVTMRITERMQSPTATLNEIAGLIQTDPALTSKILRLANSSYYSIPGGVTEVPKALQYLGFTTVSQIVLTTSVLGAFKVQGSHDFPLDQFWKHSFAVGLVSEITARNLQLEHAKDAFICGLLHDIGKLILLEALPDQLHAVVRHAKENKQSFVDSERTLDLVNHAKLGVQLAEHWNLPSIIADSIHHHHDEFIKGAPLDQVLVAWSNAWVHLLNIGHSGDYSTEHETQETQLANLLGINGSQKNLIQKKFEIEFEKAGAILSGHS